MDRGSLLMRTHIISLNKRKEMNPVQQMFWAIKNDKIHEVGNINFLKKGFGKIM